MDICYVSLIFVDYQARLYLLILYFYRESSMNYLKLVFILLLVLQVSSSTCGGNCPTGDCSTCTCGSTTRTVSLDDFCSASTKWTTSCCKCIAYRLSGGNANFMRQASTKYVGYFGVMALDDQTAFYYCKDFILKDKDLCDPTKNAKCAEIYYSKKNGWEDIVWREEAKSCGCWSSTETSLQLDSEIAIR